MGGFKTGAGSIGFLDQIFGRGDQKGRQLSTQIKQQVKRRDNYTCQECGRSSEKVAELHVHHITPRSKGGSDDPANLVTLCDYCHKQQPEKGHNLIKPRAPAPGGAAETLMFLVFLFLGAVGLIWAYNSFGFVGLFVAGAVLWALIME